MHNNSRLDQKMLDLACMYNTVGQIVCSYPGTESTTGYIMLAGIVTICICSSSPHTVMHTSIAIPHMHEAG